MPMELSDETYDLIEEQYGESTANYAKNMVEDYHSEFPNLEGMAEDVGVGASMAQYRETRGEEGLEAALEEFAQDLEETRQRGVLELLAEEVNTMEI